MKSLIVILLLAGGCYWLYTNKSTQKEFGGNFAEELKERKSVPIEKIKNQSNKLVTYICEDSVFQESIGSSVDACMKRYAEFKELCEKSIFPDPTLEVKSLDEIKAYVSRYRKCIIKVD